MTRSAFLHSDVYTSFKAYDDYPWLFERSKATFAQCQRQGLISRPETTVVEPKPATVEAAALFHAREYLEILERANDGTFDESMLFNGVGSLECPVYPGCLDYHLLMLGSTLEAARLVTEDDFDVAFSATGGMHHAGIDFAAGFCYINDAVLGVKELLGRGKRVLYVDIDAHHGDGVQSAFFHDPRVLKISFHESPETLFPFKTGFRNEIGLGAGRGYNVNIPLPAGTGDEAFTWAFERIVPPLARAFEPDVLLGVIGPDLLSADPMTHLRVTTDGFTRAIEWFRKLAPRVIALGCGGYLLDSVERALTLAWAVLNEVPIVDDAELLFGGAFRGDGLSSLQDQPVFIPEDTRQRSMSIVRELVETIETESFPKVGAKKA